MKTPSWFLNKNFISYSLLPLSFLYFVFSKLVYFFRLPFKIKSKRKIICIGNIFAGGIGKTPIVLTIAKKLKIPVVMRGYKKKKNDIGDEAKIFKNAKVDVFVGSRKINIKTLNNFNSNKPILMDDGFQNSSIKKDISILVFDENVGLANGFVLPSGPFRETLRAIRRSDAILIIEGKTNKLKEKLNKYKKPMFFVENKTLLPSIKYKKIIAFAGIGYPEKFFKSLSIKPFKTFSFSDHHDYTKKDLDNLILLAKKEKASLITTEKDWVKFSDSYKKKIKFATLDTKIENRFWIWLKGKINEDSKKYN